jgi:hypothetical protein
MIQPTLSYSKGEKYSRGPKGGELVGRTGMWFFSTREIVAGGDLDEHLLYLMLLLMPVGVHKGHAVPLVQKVDKLRKYIDAKDLEAAFTCFWHGRHGEKKPTIPKFMRWIAMMLSAEILTDYGTDSEEPKRRQVTRA